MKRLTLASMTMVVLCALVVLSCETYERRTGITTGEPAVNGANATLYGTIDDLSKKPHNDHGFFYSTSPQDVGTQVSLGANLDVGRFTSEVNDLNALATYYVRAYVKEGSDYMYGETVSFQTQGSITTPTVTTSSVTSITSNSAACGGNVTASGGRNVTARGICWNTAPNPSIDNSKVQSGSGLGVFTANVTGLSFETTYYVRAWATNDSGTAYGLQVQFTTGTILSSPANGVSGLANPITFQWSAVSGATSYQLQVSLVSDFSSLVLDQSGITSTSYTPSALSNNTYHWRIRASNAGGAGNWTTAWSFTMSPPGVPTLILPANGATGVANSPTFQWSAVSGATSYQLQVSTSSGFGTTAIDQSGITATSYASTTSLASGTLYYWRLRATNASGTGNWSSTSSFTTTTTTVTDIDGNVYHIVTIGTKQWLVENLKTRHYRNGDSIPNITSNSSWAAVSTGAYCDYNNSSSNGATYGHLYNWYAVNDSRGLAPTGWHVATDAEWTTLVNAVGGESVAGTKLKSTSGWNGGGNGTNDYGFTALPGGVRGNDGAFYNVGDGGYWWSSTEGSTTYAWSRYVNYSNADVLRSGSNKENGLSVRCVRD